MWSALPRSPTEMNLSQIAQLQFYPSSPITSTCTLVQQAIGTPHLIRQQVPGPGPCISPMLLDPAVKRQPVVTNLTWKFTSLTQTLRFFSTGRFFILVPEEARGHIFISFYQRPYQGLILNQITSYVVRKLCSALLSMLQSVVENSQGVWNIQDRGRKESNWDGDIAIAFLYKACAYNRWTKSEISKNRASRSLPTQKRILTVSLPVLKEEKYQIELKCDLL